MRVRKRWFVGASACLILSIAAVGIVDAIWRSGVHSEAKTKWAHTVLIEKIKEKTLENVETGVEEKYKDNFWAFICGTKTAVVNSKKEKALKFVKAEKDNFSLHVDSEPSWGLAFLNERYRFGAKWGEHLLATFRLNSRRDPVDFRYEEGRAIYDQAVRSAVGEGC